MKVPPCFFLSRLLIDRCKINIIKNYFYSSEYNNKLYNRVMSDGEIDQNKNKLQTKVNQNIGIQNPSILVNSQGLKGEN